MPYWDCIRIWCTPITVWFSPRGQAESCLFLALSEALVLEDRQALGLEDGHVQTFFLCCFGLIPELQVYRTHASTLRPKVHK